MKKVVPHPFDALACHILSMHPPLLWGHLCMIHTVPSVIYTRPHREVTHWSPEETHLCVTFPLWGLTLSVRQVR